MAFELTERNLKKHLRERKQYSSCLELNEVLHLQCKGISRIVNLEKFTGLQTLYLQGNAIEEITGLDCLVNLRCLYLNQNLIKSIAGLDSLQKLASLDLSENFISDCKGLEGLQSLSTLNLSRNSFTDAENFAPLGSLGDSLLSLDISHNQLPDLAIVDILERNHGNILRLLRLVGNPVASAAGAYRKVIITKFTSLKYLDSHPVFEKERRLALSFSTGGMEAERLERKKIKEEEHLQSAKYHAEFQNLINSSRQNKTDPKALCTARNPVADGVENSF